MAVKFDPILSAVREADTGTPGADGADGLGVPPGGTTGQVLAKIDNTDNNTEWISPETLSGGISESLAIAYAVAL